MNTKDFNKIKSAYFETGNGRSHQMIYRIRRKAKMNNFDEVLRDMAKLGFIELTGGNPSKMSNQEINESYIDSMGYLLPSMCWRI